MRALALLIALTIPTLAAAAPGDGVRDRRDIVLAPGEQKIIPGEGVDSLSTSVPNIVEVRVTDDEKQVLIVGMAPGTTSLLVLMRNGTRFEYNITVSRLRMRRNIRLDVYFVEVKRNRGLQLGVLWPGSVAATAIGQAAIDQSGAIEARASVVSQVIPQLDLARTQGWAKLLDQARVVMANGEEGTYSSGGEVNVRLATGFAANLEKIAYGTQVTARLSYDDVTGRIEGRVKIEVSRLVNGVDDLPGRSLVQAGTTVNIELGQSIAVAGLFSDDEAEDSQGLPILSEIPIIGYLFGTHSHSRGRVENMIFLVPTLVSAVGLEQRDRVAEAFTLFKNYEGQRRDRNLPGLMDDAEWKPAKGRKPEPTPSGGVPRPRRLDSP